MSGITMHAKDGLHFEQREDGAVCVTIRDKDVIKYATVLDGDCWCSLISTMSKHGEADGGFYLAKLFHEAKPIPPSHLPPSVLLELLKYLKLF